MGTRRSIGANIAEAWFFTGYKKSCFLSIFLSFTLCFGVACSKRADSLFGKRPKGVVQFIDVAAKAGIKFKHINGASGRYYMPETYGSGCCFFDYDNDGNLDIYIVNSGELPGFKSSGPIKNALYRNNSNGTFTDVTEKAGVAGHGFGMGAVAADYDNDGYEDLYVTCFGPNILYHNNGNGTFTDVTAKAGVGDPRWSSSAAFLDYDKDGFLDLFVVNYVDFKVEGNKYCDRDGKQIYCPPQKFNGVPDVLYRNNRDGTFTDVTKKSGLYVPPERDSGKGLGVVCGDYDNDGDIDIYVANDETPGYLYRNNGDGTFTEVATVAGVAYNEDGEMQAGMGTDFGDYNNDGLLDLWRVNYSFETNTLYRNNGNGFFTDVTFPAGLGEPSWLSLGFGTSFFDYDSDGDVDIFVANGHVEDNIEQFYGGIVKYAQINQLFRNDNGRFTEVTSQAGNGLAIKKVSRGAAFGDYDNDGDIDIFVTNNNDTPDLLRNEGGNDSNWLMIKTVGTRSNRDGIGSRIKVVAGPTTQIREIKAGYSYLSGSDLRAHFGLGSYKKADLVEIKWPSGIVQTFRDVKVNQIFVIKEQVK